MSSLEFAGEVILVSASGVLSPGPLFFINIIYGSEITQDVSIPGSLIIKKIGEVHVPTATINLALHYGISLVTYCIYLIYFK